MNSQAIKPLVTLFLCMITAVVLGLILASGDFDRLFLLSYLLMGIYVLTAPGFIPLIAIGLLNPFVLPIPYIRGFPFMLLILGICCVKLFFRNALRSQSKVLATHCFTLGSVMFFAWVAMRYLMNPVMPNISGFGQNVTGFRSYLNYGLCFALIVLLPIFVPGREDVLRLLRWMGGISLFFIVVLTPLIFTKSAAVALWLYRFGLTVSTFDNGCLRFVALPEFGLIVFTLALLPSAVPNSARKRVFLGAVGLTAIVMGGSRGSLIMAFVILLTVMFVRRGLLVFSCAVLVTSASLATFHYVGQQMDIRYGVGFLRILSLTSQRIAENTDAASNVEWRKLRWKRALEEIKNNPIFGKGYGGLENAWIFSDMAQFDQSAFEVDLATGGIHNGYLNSAYALGIPATLLFLFALIRQIWVSGVQVRRQRDSDPVMSDLQSFVCANLAGFGAVIYIGADLNTPIIWFYLASGVLLTRLKRRESAAQLENAPVRALQPSLSAHPSSG
jgi:O-antigen ligase